MKRILFICAGNTCRSAMAEGLFNDAVQKSEKHREKFIAYSAGLYAYDGEGAHPRAIRTLKSEWGIDISSHQATAITKQTLNESDLILVMTRGHKKELLSRFDIDKQKVFTLKEFVADSPSRDSGELDVVVDIADPFGSSADIYKSCAQEIKAAIDKMMGKIVDG